MWVQPGARKTEVSGLYQQCVRIRLAAPAVDNKANKALVAFVADALRLKKNQVTIEHGHASRKKHLAIASTAEPDWRVFL